MLLHQPGDLLQSLPALDAAGRIAGGIDDQHPGLVGDEALNLVGIHLIVPLLLQGVGHGHGAEELGHMDVVEPHGVGDQHLVPGAEKGGHGGIGALAYADGHQDLLGGVVDAVVPAELLRNGGAQLGGAVVGGIKDVALFEALVGGFLDDGRGVEVGAADLHMDHIHSLLLHLSGPLHHDADLREGQGLHSACGFKHSVSPFSPVAVVFPMFRRDSVMIWPQYRRKTGGL